jgi:hypothetical protein
VTRVVRWRWERKVPYAHEEKHDDRWWRLWGQETTETSSHRLWNSLLSRVQCSRRGQGFEARRDKSARVTV